MTRKKFIKSLMAEEMQRNDAALCAELARRAGRAYIFVSGDLLNWHKHHFKHPAFDVMFLRIMGTIVHGPNPAAREFFASIDEMHTHKDEQILRAMQTGVSVVKKAVDNIVEVLPTVVEGIVAAIPQLLDAINEASDSGQPSALLGGGGA